MYPTISIGSIHIESYTLCYILVFLIVTLLVRQELKNRQYPLKILIGLFITGLFFGIMGAKIYYFLENWEAFIIDPYHTFFTVPGSGWYGAFIFGLIGIILYLKFNKLQVISFLDMLAPFILIGQASGRLGCFLAGCCYGIPSNLPWAVQFPNTIFAPHVRVHPTQLYELIIYFSIAFLLLRLKKRNLKPGTILGLYLILAGAGRFIVEFYRVNPKIVAQFSAPQIIAFIGILFGIYFIFRTSKPVTAFYENSKEQHKILAI